jgi:lipopolysaccharide cholinephosphotransferase
MIDMFYVILIFVAFIIYLDYVNSIRIDNLEMSETDKEDIFYFLDYFTKFLEKHNITYWIIGGTTLGAIRHNDIVPWDDDADIGIHEKDLGKLLSLNDELKNDGFEIIFYWKIHKFRRIGKEYPFVDIFCYKKEDDIYVMNREDLREVWPKEYYLEDELFPLKEYKFGHLTLLGPNYPLDYLDRLYPNWRHVGKHTFDHKENKGTNITIELEQSNPAHKLKPLLYVNSNCNVKKEFNEYYNEKIVTIE